MPARAERPAWHLAGPGALALGAALLGVPAYLWLGAGWRTLAARVAGAVMVAALALRVRRAARRAVEGAPPSALDACPVPAPPARLDERFLRVRDDLAFSRRSRRYFEAILWPRLLGLAGGDLAPPAPRPWLVRRGPSTAVLRALVGELERRA